MLWPCCTRQHLRAWRAFAAQTLLTQRADETRPLIPCLLGTATHEAARTAAPLPSTHARTHIRHAARLRGAAARRVRAGAARRARGHVPSLQLQHRGELLPRQARTPPPPPRHAALAIRAHCAALRWGVCVCACSHHAASRRYIERPWYSIEQAVTSYQPRESLFCVRAEYRQSPNDPTRLLVFNQGKRGSVSGTSQAGAGFLLNAVVKDESRGKLAVGPPFLPTSAYGALRAYTRARVLLVRPTMNGELMDAMRRRACFLGAQVPIGWSPPGRASRATPTSWAMTGPSSGACPVRAYMFMSMHSPRHKRIATLDITLTRAPRAPRSQRRAAHGAGCRQHLHQHARRQRAGGRRRGVLAVLS